MFQDTLCSKVGATGIVEEEEEEDIICGKKE
jgi:hypothetical protein